MNKTKENILLAALRLFAKDGYEAVSVSQIAGELGITKGALYKHYKNKRDIFDSILRRMEQNDAEHAKTFELPKGKLDQMKEEYDRASLNQLVKYSKAQLRYWTEDDFASLFRKILTLEQYRSEEMGKLYHQYFGAGPLEYVTDLLAAMGLKNPQLAAAEFYGPMYMFFSIYDASDNKNTVFALANAHFDKVRDEFAGGIK